MTSAAERLTSLRPYLAGTVLFAVAMGVGRFAYTPLLVVMRADAGLGVTAAGVLASANLAGYLAGALAAALPAMHRRRVAVVIGAAAAIAVLTAAMAGPVWLWVAARTLTGICSGLVFVLTVGIVLDHAKVHRSPWGAPLLFAGVGLGIAASGLLVPALAPLGGSRAAWLGIGALSAIAIALVARWVPRDEPAHTEAQPVRAVSGAAPSPVFWWLALVYGIEGGVYIIPATFLVAMMAETPALAPIAPFTWVVVGLLSVPSAALWTAAAQRIGVAGALTLALVVQAVALLIPSVAGGFAGALSVAIGIGATFIAISALALTLGRAYWPARSNTAAGLLTALYGVGQIAGPLFATHVAVRTGSYRAALPLAAAALLATTAPFVLAYAISSTRWAEKTRKRVS